MDLFLSILSIVLAAFFCSAILTLATFFISPLRAFFRALDDKPKYKHLEKLNFNPRLDENL